jgi:hypothetical protein
MHPIFDLGKPGVCRADRNISGNSTDNLMNIG